MNSNSKIVFPMALVDLPDWFYYLLVDSGVPVVRRNKDDLQLSEHLVIITDSLLQLSNSSQAIIDWSSLWPIRNQNSLMQSLYSPLKMKWFENEISLSENCMMDQTRSDIINNIKSYFLKNEIPWIQFDHFPSGYSGVLNFRVDVDENCPEDWFIVRRELEPVKHFTSWFLCTSATEQSPLIYQLLRDCDVHSHGETHHFFSCDNHLNRLSFLYADHVLKNRGYHPAGMAPPGGRLVPFASTLAAELKYQFVAGLGDPSGNLPIRDANGIWQVHALPLSEGLYLDQGIHETDVVCQGYLAIAERAFRNQKPVFLYGHAERRLGRKPNVIRRIVDHLSHLSAQQSCWGGTIPQYLKWLEKRSQAAIELCMADGNDHPVVLKWSHAFNQEYPQISLDWKGVSQKVALDSNHHEMKLVNRRNPLPFSIAIDKKPDVLAIPIVENKLLRNSLRTMLDWERVSPVVFLCQGNWRSRIKAILRMLTDKAWQRKFSPKCWEFEEVESDQRSIAA